jgi:hypothetical protein
MTNVEREEFKIELLGDTLIQNMVNTLGALQAANATAWPTTGTEQIAYNGISKINVAVNLAVNIVANFYTPADLTEEKSIVRKLTIKWLINDFEGKLSAYADHEDLIMYDDHQWGEE